MTNKQKYDAIVEKINALEVEKNKIYQEMISEDMSDKDKFHLIVDSDIHCNSIISYNYNGGVLDKMLDGEYYQRHETVYIDNINTIIIISTLELADEFKALPYCLTPAGSSLK